MRESEGGLTRINENAARFWSRSTLGLGDPDSFPPIGNHPKGSLVETINKQAKNRGMEAGADGLAAMRPNVDGRGEQPFPQGKLEPHVPIVGIFT